jgi:hypothetical protein
VRLIDTKQHLSAGFFKTQFWHEFTNALEAQLEQLRLENDNDLDERQTAKVRGRIAEIKSMLVLDRPDPAMSVTSATDLWAAEVTK